MKIVDKVIGTFLINKKINLTEYIKNGLTCSDMDVRLLIKEALKEQLKLIFRDLNHPLYDGDVKNLEKKYDFGNKK